MERASEVEAAGLLRRPAAGEARAAGRARLAWRALVAPLVLAAYTVAAAAGAALALAPAALAGGPLGRRRRVRPGARGGKEREALGG